MLGELALKVLELRGEALDVGKAVEEFLLGEACTASHV